MHGYITKTSSMLQQLSKFKYGFNNTNHYNAIIQNATFANISHPEYVDMKNNNLTINCDIITPPQHKEYLNGNIFCDMNFLATELVDAEFIHSNFDKICFYNMIQMDMYFMGVNCNNVHFNKNCIDNSYFIDTIYNHSFFSNTTSTNCYYENVTFNDAIFSNPQFIDCVFINCKFIECEVINKKRLVFSDNCIFFGCEFIGSKFLDNELSMKQEIANYDKNNYRDSSYAFVETHYNKE